MNTTGEEKNMRIPKRCPVCGASKEWRQITAWREGFSFPKALLGGCLLGGMGLLAGIDGRTKRLFRCRACGYAMQYER